MKEKEEEKEKEKMGRPGCPLVFKVTDAKSTEPVNSAGCNFTGLHIDLLDWTTDPLNPNSMEFENSKSLPI